MISHYPDGYAGIALLLLRVACALTGFSALAYLSPAPAGGNAATIASGIMALAFAAGFCTRITALLLGVGLIADLFITNGRLVPLLALASVAGALVLLGPGAYSLDALRYGRRVIRLERRSPDQGGRY